MVKKNKIKTDYSWSEDGFPNELEQISEEFEELDEEELEIEEESD